MQIYRVFVSRPLAQTVPREFSSIAFCRTHGVLFRLFVMYVCSYPLPFRGSHLIRMLRHADFQPNCFALSRLQILQMSQSPIFLPPQGQAIPRLNAQDVILTAGIFPRNTTKLRKNRYCKYISNFNIKCRNNRGKYQFCSRK